MTLFLVMFSMFGILWGDKHLICVTLRHRTLMKCLCRDSRGPLPPGCTYNRSVITADYRYYIERPHHIHLFFLNNCTFNQLHLINSKIKTVLNCRLAIASLCECVCVRACIGGGHNPGSAGVAEIQIDILKAVLRIEDKKWWAEVVMVKKKKVHQAWKAFLLQIAFLCLVPSIHPIYLSSRPLSLSNSAANVSIKQLTYLRHTSMCWCQTDRPRDALKHVYVCIWFIARSD